MVVRFIVFLTSTTLICRGTDISKCFRESPGIRDNESRLYVYLLAPMIKIKALVGRSLSVGWANGPERGLSIVSFNPRLPVI